MGIPGFYQWLVHKYPNTLCSVVEHHSPSPDITKPNPNGVEFDNLYIDLNGPIHTCFHPKGIPAPQSYDDIFKFIFMYIDRVFSVVRPRKLLYLALDGVAPPAKMNYERIRRFRAAREAAGKGMRKREGEEKLDPNVITPGTEFMDLLSRALKYFVCLRLNTDPGWRGIKVIVSDSTVVGEGKDKIMSYVRSQRNLPGYDPNTRHCLHGLDADSILLALATHEIHISYLREVITHGRKCRNEDLLYSQCMSGFMIDLEFEFFNIWVLREYLERELLPNEEGTEFDRLIDDFVFMCVFVGNDYLPHLPSLGVFTGGIKLALMVYQQEFTKMGYLTNAPEVNLKSMEHFLQALSSHENIFLMNRIQLNMEKNKRKRKGFQDSYDQLKTVEPGIISAPDPSPGAGDVEHEPTTNKVKIPGSYVEQHYTMNFDCKSDDVDRIKRHAVLKYTEGMCWIMHSYYQQVPSWQWFYPYHYAPLASDFCDLDKLEINFTLGQPFKPLDQLLGVLPAARELITSESSPILDFYPKGAKTSKHVKIHDRRGLCKLPFIDESRLLFETAKVEHTLTDEERERNRFGRDMLFVHSSHPLAEMIKDLPSSDPSSDVQLQIRPDLSDGMNGYLCVSDKPVFPSNIPSPFVDEPEVKIDRVKSVGYKCPSHAHNPKLLCGVKMPPKILRHQDRPRSCPIKIKKQDNKSCMLGDATEAGYCVDLAVARQQGGSKDEGKQQNVINGKLEAGHVFERSQNHLIGGKLTNQTDAQQQIKAGNGGMSDGKQRDDKPFTGGDGEHESLGDKPKRRRKNRKNKQLDVQQGYLVDRGSEAKEHEEKGEVSEGIKIKVDGVEAPTICEKPSTGGDGEHESPGGKPKRKRKNRKKQQQLDAQQEGDLVDSGAEAKEHEVKGEVLEGIEIKVNSVDELAICQNEFTGAEAKGEVPRRIKNTVNIVSGEPTDLVVGKVKDENMNDFQVGEEKANKKHSDAGEENAEKKKKKKKVRGDDAVNEIEATENEDDGEKTRSKKRRRKRQPTQEAAATEESDLLSAKE